MEIRKAEGINQQIMENELSAADWELNNLVWELSWWVSAFQIMFFKDQPLPTPPRVVGPRCGVISATLTFITPLLPAASR